MSGRRDLLGLVVGGLDLGRLPGFPVAVGFFGDLVVVGVAEEEGLVFVAGFLWPMICRLSIPICAGQNEGGKYLEIGMRGPGLCPFFCFGPAHRLLTHHC